MKKTRVVIDGRRVKTREDLHAALKRGLRLPEHYGMNLDALWDSLTGDVPGPVRIEWTHAEVSKANLGEYFDRTCRLFDDLAKQDPTFSFEIR